MVWAEPNMLTASSIQIKEARETRLHEPTLELLQRSMRSRKLGGCNIWATKHAEIDGSDNIKLPNACVKIRTDFQEDTIS